MLSNVEHSSYQVHSADKVIGGHVVRSWEVTNAVQNYHYHKSHYHKSRKHDHYCRNLRQLPILFARLRLRLRQRRDGTYSHFVAALLGGEVLNEECHPLAGVVSDYLPSVAVRGGVVTRVVLGLDVPKEARLICGSTVHWKKWVGDDKLRNSSVQP